MPYEVYDTLKENAVKITSLLFQRIHSEIGNTYDIDITLDIKIYRCTCDKYRTVVLELTVSQKSRICLSSANDNP